MYFFCFSISTDFTVNKREYIIISLLPQTAVHKCTGKLKDTEHIIHTRGLNKHSRIQYEKNKNGDAVLCPDLDYIAYLFTGHLLGEFFSPLTSS